VFAVAAVLFASLAADLRFHGPVTSADTGISIWFHGRMNPLLTQLMLLVTHWHSTPGLIVMTLVASVFLLWKKQGDWLVALLVCVSGGQILNVLVKHAFERARPSFDDPALTLATYSFPSGHTAGATVWWGFMWMLYRAVEPRPGRRAAGLAFAIAMVLTTALSRVYLGVHYPSDVFAAAAEGVAWLAVCFTLLARRKGL
jgi:undecaprenyl-diphosphatase